MLLKPITTEDSEYITPGIDKIKYLTNEQATDLLNSIDSLRDKTIFTFAYYHGLRASEVGRLKEKYFSAESKQLFIPRIKNGKARTHDLSDDQCRLLNRWMKVRGYHGEDTPLFPSRRGVGIGRRMLDVLMKKYGQLAKIPEGHRHFHVLRHTCAVHLVQVQPPLNLIVIRDWLGHRKLESTLIYANVSDKALSDAASKFYESVAINGPNKDKDKGKRKDKAKGKIKDNINSLIGKVKWNKDGK